MAEPAELKIKSAPDSSVAPPAATPALLNAQASSAAIVTAYCYSLLDLEPRPHPDGGAGPAWFAESKAALDLAKVQAKDWVTNLRPEIFSKVPLAIINYSNNFMGTAAEIETILNAVRERRKTAKAIRAGIKNKTVPAGTSIPEVNLSDDELDLLKKLVRRLSKALTDQEKVILKLQQDLQKFTNALIDQHGAFKRAAQAASTEKAKSDVRLKEYQELKKQIEQNLANARKAKETSGWLAIGAVIVVGIATIVTAGWALVAIAVIGAGVYGYGLYSGIRAKQMMEADMVRLGELAGKLSDEQKLHSWLENTGSAFDTIVTENEKASKAMGDVLAMWSTLKGKLAAVLKAITAIEKRTEGKPEDGEPEEDPEFDALSAQLDLNLSRESWRQLVEFANKMHATTIVKAEIATKAA
ncbi:hypothetical protein OF829_10075 [Sphingomonas sp. LB-2]|uniref:hypothetical protein n=1 Tax=Sphingomonas caeni TaxID=2984949 RepID=UPI0022327722|nr:hypothetical protein [Sphingomonas caeni]MCW3847590.1 hypothetical protein [Sphingomonas caeni]